MNKWIAEFDLEYGDTMPEHMDLNYMGGKIDFHCRPMWIPCSERLPDELAEVNITWVNTDPEPYYDFIKGKPFVGTAVYFKGKWFWYSSVCKDYLAEYGFSPSDEMDEAIKVTAWCELPEPYKDNAMHSSGAEGTKG